MGTHKLILNESTTKSNHTCHNRFHNTTTLIFQYELIIHLSNVILVHGPLDAYPRAPLESSGILHYPHDIRHLPYGHHQLLPLANAQVPYVLNGLLDVLLLVRLHVDVALQALHRHHALDMEGLKMAEGKSIGKGILILASHNTPFRRAQLSTHLQVTHLSIIQVSAITV